MSKSTKKKTIILNTNNVLSTIDGGRIEQTAKKALHNGVEAPLGTIVEAIQSDTTSYWIVAARGDDDKCTKWKEMFIQSGGRFWKEQYSLWSELKVGFTRVAVHGAPKKTAENGWRQSLGLPESFLRITEEFNATGNFPHPLIVTEEDSTQSTMQREIAYESFDMFGYNDRMGFSLGKPDDFDPYPDDSYPDDE